MKVEVDVLGPSSPNSPYDGLCGRKATLNEHEREREEELRSRSWMGCLAAGLFLNSFFSGNSDTVFATLLTEATIRGVHKLLDTGGVPTSLTPSLPCHRKTTS